MENYHVERRKEERYVIRNLQDANPTMNDLIDRYMKIPYRKRHFVELCFENALKIVEHDLKREHEVNNSY